MTTKQHQKDKWNRIKDTYPWQANIDYRQCPQLYRVGKGEQGVLICQPYASEIGQHWRFKTALIAQQSSQKIYSMFKNYLKKADFVGSDMARKFAQMGYTRARRYANHRSGRKYDSMTGEQLPLTELNPVKIQSANIFYKVWQKMEKNVTYARLKINWKKSFG